MLTLDEALERVLAHAVPLPAETVPLWKSPGRILAEDLLSPEDLPRFDYSAMDGYAVAVGDFAGEAPYSLPLRGQSRAGHAPPVLAPGSTCRIFTGAPLPERADAVVLQEDVESNGGEVRFSRVPRPGEHIRRRGEDLRQGALALARGTRLGAFELGLAAALDRAELRVARRPAVSVLCTGDELRAPGEPGPPGTLPESNGIALSVLAESAGAEVRHLERSGDDASRLTASMRRLAEESDVLVTVGGASVGEHDLVRKALLDAGGSIEFWKVKIKPGKPVIFGKLANALLLGLPGNPVSAQITFALFGLPLLSALQGATRRGDERGSARLASELRQKPGRLGLYRARLEGDLAYPQDNQASGSVASLAHADALVLVPAESEGYAAGERVSILRLPRT